MTDVPPGSSIPGDGPAGWPPPPAAGGSQPPAQYGSSDQYGGQRASNGAGTAALAVGIIALLVSWIPFLGLILALVALVLGVVGLRKASRGQATNKNQAVAGVVTGGIALLIGVVVTAASIAFFDEFQNLTECLADAETTADEEECERQFEDEFGQ